MTENFSLATTLRGPYPRVPFARIKKTILGERYELSLVLIGDTLATRLNREHKGKTEPTNILSFPLTKTEGEIFLNVRRAARDAKKFGHTHTQHIAFLFIHGCLHLSGMHHGNALEKKEEALLAQFFPGTRN